VAMSKAAVCSSFAAYFCAQSVPGEIWVSDLGIVGNCLKYGLYLKVNTWKITDSETGDGLLKNNLASWQIWEVYFNLCYFVVDWHFTLKDH